MTSQSTFTLPQMMVVFGLMALTPIAAQFLVPTPEMPQEYAPDPTPQLALLAVAVATVAVTKVVGWYRRRGSADQ